MRKASTKAARKSPPKRKRTTQTNGSPVERVNISRDISNPTRVLLNVRAGGRCEFDGCNKYLFCHHLTHAEENFSQMAHIVAFKPDGPRGKSGLRPKDINNVHNLMLLCPQCHHLIDRRPKEFPRETLEKYKKNHEERIIRLTAIEPDSKTTVVQLLSRIGDKTVAIPPAEIYKAISPRYAHDPQGVVIDLTHLDGQDENFYAIATRTIEKKIERLYEPGMEADQTRHISLFAMAPMPLLVFLGSQLSSRVAVELYQRHRVPSESWEWKTYSEPIQYKFHRRREGMDAASVALLLSLSGSTHLSDLPAELDEKFFIYEITLAKDTPRPSFLRTREDLVGFKDVYEEARSSIRRDHAGLTALHLFPAVPAPVAVLCGRELLPKVDPTLIVYDRDKNQAGFQKILRVN
ncbi:MAG TPA: SAVED domain-containing protein [Nitrososphaera sp.]|nr:SAVED domain-containing protein [Nitrososphaera sp.]